jgi:hypothetical protein
MSKKDPKKKGFNWTLLISIAALVLSGSTFWYTFLRPSSLFVSLPPNILLQKMALLKHGVNKELPCMVMPISFSAYGPKSVAIEDILLKLHNKDKEFYFFPKREIIELIVPRVGKLEADAPEPKVTIMKPIHLPPNSSQMANYIFTPYDDTWTPYSCLGELELTLYVKINKDWVKKDKSIYINHHANWETMKGFDIVSYSERESSVKEMDE